MLVPLALFGVFVTWPIGRGCRCFYALIAAYAASVVMFYVFARYRFPLVPLLVLFAAAGLGAAAGAWFGIAPARVGGFAGRWRRRDGRLHQLADAVVAADEGDHRKQSRASLSGGGHGCDEAADHYRRAIALEPGYAPAYNNLGTALRARDSVDEAVAAYERALSIAPTIPMRTTTWPTRCSTAGRTKPRAFPDRPAVDPDRPTRNNLGIALMAEGKVDEAIAQFEEALRAEPGSARSHKNLGEALATAACLTRSSTCGAPPSSSRQTRLTTTSAAC